MKTLAALATLLVLPGLASAQYSYSWYHPANWGSPHTDLGPNLASFEQLTLPTGLKVSVNAPGGSYGPTSTLPGLYVTTFDSSQFSMGRYDGQCALLNTLHNGISESSDSNVVGDLTLTFDSGVTMLGFSMGQLQPSAHFRINGTDMGTFLPTFSSLLSGEYSREGYFVITGPRINTFTLDVAEGDAFVMDHLVFQPAPVPEPGVWAGLGLGALALIRRRRAV